MSHFPAPVSTPNHGKWTRTLVEDWTWRTGMRGRRYCFYVPAGVQYEPSIPTFAEGLIPADRLEPASLIHDVIYKMQGDFSQTEHRVVQGRRNQRQPFVKVRHVSRKFADDVFRLILDELGVSSWRTWLAYRAVRWFGQNAWDEEDDFHLPT
jgi:hypothetical protein